MAENATSPISFTSTFGGGGGRRGLVITLALDIVLPWLTVRVLEHHGMAGVPAFAVAAIFPLASVVLSWLRQGRAEIIGIAVVVTMALGILVAVASDDVRFSVMKASPATALFGLICLVSLAARRPVMFFVARYFIAGADPVKRAAWDERLAIPGFARSMRLLTLVWGIAALLTATAGIAVAFLLPAATALVLEPVVHIGAVAGLLAWTASYARRRGAAGGRS